jgi:hypothetical protein
MKIVLIVGLISTISAFTFSCSCRQEKTDGGGVSAPATTSRFETGQVWTFHIPANELTNTALTIARVDFDLKLGPIIYVSVTGGRVNRRWGRPYVFYPFSEDALSRSVVTLLKTNNFLAGEELKDFQDAYELLQQNVQAGKANKCFKTTVGEVLEAQLNANQ